MTIRVECQKCSKQYQMSDDKAGRKFRCRACEAVIHIPDEAEYEDEYEAPARPRRKPASKRGRAGGGRKKSRSKKSKSGANTGRMIGIAVGVIAVTVISIFSYSVYQQDQPTTPEETVSSPETPNSSDEPAAKAGVPVVNSIGMRFVPIPAGTFTAGTFKMGDADYGPAHKVTLTQAFELGQHEVTQEQYEKVMGKNPSKFKGKQKPVEQVSWNDAVEFCRKLSELPEEKSGDYAYRLPTEAEWEYSCRAGTKTSYSFGWGGTVLGDYAWYQKNSGNTTHAVGGKKPNTWGLYDMHGNVWEWCQDWYDDYPSGSVTDPTGAASGSYRVLRGGGWFGNSEYCRSAYRLRFAAGRDGGTPDFRGFNVGFRVLRSSIK